MYQPPPASPQDPYYDTPPPPPQGPGVPPYYGQQPPHPGQPPFYGAAPPVSDQQTKTWATLIHASGLSCYLGLPLGNILVPTVLWMLRRDEDPEIDQIGADAVNFQITITIFAGLAILASIILIGIPVLIGVFLAHVIVGIAGTIRAAQGKTFSYPFGIEFVKPAGEARLPDAPPYAHPGQVL